MNHWYEESHNYYTNNTVDTTTTTLLLPLQLSLLPLFVYTLCLMLLFYCSATVVIVNEGMTVTLLTNWSDETHMIDKDDKDNVIRYSFDEEQFKDLTNYYWSLQCYLGT